jgi:hypothetical protein
MDGIRATNLGPVQDSRRNSFLRRLREQISAVEDVISLHDFDSSLCLFMYEKGSVVKRHSPLLVSFPATNPKKSGDSIVLELLLDLIKKKKEETVI